MKVNGVESEVPDNSSVQDLIQGRGLKNNLIIIELNGNILRRDQWENTRLNPDDSLEIIQIIGGG